MARSPILTNYAEDNLAFLCMEHHSLYDSTTSQHKNYTLTEAKDARQRLYAAIVAQEHVLQEPLKHAGLPKSIRIKYSNRYVLTVSSVPGYHDNTLNLDNVATLYLLSPSNRDVVTLGWPLSPPLVVANPKSGEKYTIPGQGEKPVQFTPAAQMRGPMRFLGKTVNLHFTNKAPVHYIRVGERIFRISLESVHDRASDNVAMSFEYTFAVSEEDPTADNRRLALTQESVLAKHDASSPQKQTEPAPFGDAAIENILAAMKKWPVGNFELRLPETVNGQSHTVRLAAGTKLFVFDPITRTATFQMKTASGKHVDLQLPLKEPSPDGRHYLLVFWDLAKGAKLSVNGKSVADGL